MNKTKDKGMWKRTFGLFANIKIPIPLYILQAILGIISTKVALLYVPYETDLKLGNIEDGTAIWKYIILVLMTAVVSIAANVPEFYSNAIVSRNLQNKLISRSVRLPMKSFESNASLIVSWITQDCTFADGLLTSIVGFLTGIVSTYMSVREMSGIDRSMISLVVIIVAYIIFSAWLEGKFMFLRERRGRKANAELTAYMAEHLSFFTQIRQLHSQKEETKRGNEAIEKFYNADIYQSVLTFIDSFVSGSITNIITILVFVFGMKKVYDGTMSIADLAAFQSYILIAYQSLSILPNFYTNLMYYNGRLFYIASLMSEEEEVYQRERTMDIEDRDIVFDNVSFSYGENEVIKNASFTIPKGKVTVIAGPNGSGKTTLFKLLERFYTPGSGTLKFGEYDTEDIHLGEWRRSIAYVLQEPQLFNSTVRNNITYGMDREVTEEEVRCAARLACADEFIEELPERYDFEIGENGCKLSAGQRQRIAIARAVMLDPSYLLLDEATCNIDIYNAKSVTNALVKLMKGRTTIMISHDMKMLEMADHIVVINNGVVEAEGTKEEVLLTSKTLQKLVEVNA